MTDPWTGWDQHQVIGPPDEPRPIDDLEPEIVCNGRNCGGYPHE